jgi:hypothetical protein
MKSKQRMELFESDGARLRNPLRYEHDSFAPQLRERIPMAAMRLFNVLAMNYELNQTGEFSFDLALPPGRLFSGTGEARAERRRREFPAPRG